LRLFDLNSLGHLESGVFLKRQNRFLALAQVEDGVKKIHIADTGRLEEILTPNRELLLVKNRPGLKSDYTLIAAKMDDGWVLINTKLHSTIAKEAIKLGVLGFKPQNIKSEVRYKNSRLDFKVDDTFVELKGCSLVQKGLCLFPNAPTSRGVKHIKDLIEAKREGYKAIILIMALRGCECFSPHPKRDNEFKKIFYEALERGVEFRGFKVKIDENFHVCLESSLKLCYNTV